MKIIAITGGLSKNSVNARLTNLLPGLAPAGMEVIVMPIGHLPFFNQDLEANFPPEVQELKDAIVAADGVVFVTPEYNRSIPGVLNNAIDWISRPYGKNSLKGKAALTMGVSGGKLGTALAQAQLKDVLLYLDAHVVGQPEVYLGPSAELYDEAGDLKDPKTKEFLTSALAALAARANRTA